jgi:ABC-2 type transport system ATP-binding protein
VKIDCIKQSRNIFGWLQKDATFVVYYITNTLMISIANLSFRYSRKKALYSNINTTLHRGSIYGLLGKNGAGKSTLIKIICGLLFPSSGSIIVNGFTPGKRQPSYLQTIYLIPEEVYVPPVTVQKYIKLYGVFYPSFNQEQLYQYLSILEVPVNDKLSKLSFGQQKKFIIAFALACNTSLLVLDEPTNGLDIPSKVKFRRLIAAAMNESRLLIISTHQIRDLDNLIDHVMIVDNGKLLINAPLEEVSKQLSFKTVNDIPDYMPIYYSEESFRGISIVVRNLLGERTKVNLEHLFNAVTENPAASELFTNVYTVEHE